MSAPILVTGASGFVGRHLLPILAERLPGRDIVASAADVTDAGAVEAELRRVAPQDCIHLAAIASIAEARRDEARVWQVNLHGTLHLARAVMAHAPRCRFVFVSTADAYGASFAPGLPLDETAPLAPQNPYAATKAAADLALGALAADGLHAIRLRPFNHTGPGQSDAYVVPAFARQVAAAARGETDRLRVGALDVARDFLDVRDVCGAYAACVERAHEIAPGTILNIASGVPRRIGDVLDALMRMAGVSVPVEQDRSRLRVNDIRAAIGNAGAARRFLGWEPRIRWDDTLAQVLAAQL